MAKRKCTSSIIVGEARFNRDRDDESLAAVARLTVPDAGIHVRPHATTALIFITAHYSGVNEILQHPRTRRTARAASRSAATLSAILADLSGLQSTPLKSNRERSRVSNWI